jgi:hypothetical protein
MQISCGLHENSKYLALQNQTKKKVSNCVDPSWVRLAWFSTTILSPVHKNGNEPQVPQTHCSHRTSLWGEEATTQGPRFVTDIEKPILGVSQKRGENQPRFQVGSHFENCRVSKKKIITFSGYYKSIGSGFQVKVRGEKN